MTTAEPPPAANGPELTSTTATGGPSPEALRLTRTHYVQLDGLRGLAILLVILYHFFLPFPGFKGRGNGPLLQFAQMGWMGVDLFFVLSGFLITGILLETKSRSHYFRNFLARRFLRIWPLYYLTLVALLVVVPSVMPSVPPEVHSMQDKQLWFWMYAANWLFAVEGGFNHTSGGYFWSLAVEEQFYLVWPVVVWLLSTRALLRVAGILFLASLTTRILLAANGTAIGSLYPMTFTHWDGLAVGSTLAICAENPRYSAAIRKAVPLVSCLALVALVAVRLADGDWFFWSRNMTLYGYSLIALVFGGLLMYVLPAQPGTLRTRLFSNRFMTQTGRYSYALYLIHVPVVGVVYPLAFRLLGAPESGLRYLFAFTLAFGVAFAASWLGAVASWNLIERHILSLKRHFEYSAAPNSTSAAK